MVVEKRMLAALSSAIVGLAAIGVYSTVASAVARRQREIGIRMAAAIGTALAARAVFAGILFKLSPTDPLILSSAVVANSADCIARRVRAGAPRIENQSRRGDLT